MTDPTQGTEFDLERYRSYLRLLAQIHLDARLQGKVAPSDIVQETLLKAHKARQQFRREGGGAEVAAWLRKILVNTMADVLRRFTTEARDVAMERSLEASLHESSERLEAWLASEQADPQVRVEREEQLVRLAEALARLPDDQRLALQLKHLEGWSVDGIGQCIGRTPAGVAGLLRRGLKQLRTLLAEETP